MMEWAIFPKRLFPFFDSLIKGAPVHLYSLIKGVFIPCDSLIKGVFGIAPI